eukprot:TRINITY_DN46636_c0_g1_i1.p1 TRINITY_DN46636_c0_g1~~TRINITY_DN46636_c0_g1_i1.p1  ORF type:complete len:317 (+),score=34.36 TRINITY_DN46636_c0_g1_i1:42-953(+)
MALLPKFTFSALRGPELRAACGTMGCFLMTGLCPRSTRAFLRAAESFFRLPLAEKLQRQAPGRGYAPYEDGNTHLFMRRPGRPNDPLEKFIVGPFSNPASGDTAAEYYYLPNVWPEVGDVQDTARKSYEYFTGVSEAVMAALSSELGCPEEHIRSHCVPPAHVLKAHFYPGDSVPKPDQDSQFPAHTDPTLFTLICSEGDSEELEVADANGGWHPVRLSSPETALVVVGEITQRWTGGLWKAGLHRVRWPAVGGPRPARLSSVFFVIPHPSAVLASLPTNAVAPDPLRGAFSYAAYMKDRLSY